MRLPTAFLATASAVALVFTMSGTAFAADGEFTSRYLDEEGDIQIGSLIDPPSGQCIEIPEVADLEDTYAFRPRNDTKSRFWWCSRTASAKVTPTSASSRTVDTARTSSCCARWSSARPASFEVSNLVTERWSPCRDARDSRRP
ncbi:hypothetical protein [Kutzneria sp. NPDC052558]|uniref:hypothetical protein n=1 Tax=Kutzneria sp. NPDC052558 TaxID=3364121 RepID=UPI0037C84208